MEQRRGTPSPEDPRHTTRVRCNSSVDDIENRSKDQQTFLDFLPRDDQKHVRIIAAGQVEITIGDPRVYCSHFFSGSATERCRRIQTAGCQIENTIQ